MTEVAEVSLADATEKLTSLLLGAAAWQVNLGHGTNAILDFGERLPPLRPGGLLRGSVHLWISGAAWRIDRHSNAVTGSDDSGSKMAESLGKLKDLNVRSVQLPKSTLDLSIEFESSLVLRTFRCSTEEDAWRLYFPGGVVFLNHVGDFRLESG